MVVSWNFIMESTALLLRGSLASLVAMTFTASCTHGCICACVAVILFRGFFVRHLSMKSRQFLDTSFHTFEGVLSGFRVGDRGQKWLGRNALEYVVTNLWRLFGKGVVQEPIQPTAVKVVMSRRFPLRKKCVGWEEKPEKKQISPPLKTPEKNRKTKQKRFRVFFNCYAT